jgi:hypothetical protein
MTELTQINDVLAHLQKHGSITSLEAIKNFSATRLSAIIFILRKRGHNIITIKEKGKTRHNRPTQWARYVYKGELCNQE